MNSSALYLAIVLVWLIVLVPMLLRRDGADPEPGSEPETDPGAESGAEGDDREDGPDDGAVDGPAGEDDGRSAEASDEEDPDRTRILSYDEYIPGPGAGAGEDAPDAPEDRNAEPARGPTGRRSGAPAYRGGAHAPAGPTRGRVIARRRRRTVTLITLLAATGTAVGMGLGPWWVLAPPVLLLAGHLALLREAAKADAERRVAVEARRRRRAAARRRAEEAQRARTAEVIDMPAPREREVYDQYADAHQRAVGD